MIAAAGCLWALNAGYVVGSQLQGNASSSSAVAFWVVAGTIAGPVLGLAAHVLVHGRPPVAAVSVGVLVGVAVGEGAYGLTHLAETTAPGCWGAQIAFGISALLAVALTRLRSVATSVVAAVVGAAVAMAFVAIYRLDLLASFA